MHRAEWATTRGGALLIALGMLEDVQVIKDIGFALIVMSIVLDLLTKGKRYVGFMANIRDGLSRRLHRQATAKRE
ncbi:MAG: hypothetical protein ACTHM1_08740 [Solirubrobacteraceae bacterium]